MKNRKIFWRKEIKREILNLIRSRLLCQLQYEDLLIQSQARRNRLRNATRQLPSQFKHIRWCKKSKEMSKLAQRSTKTRKRTQLHPWWSQNWVKLTRSKHIKSLLSRNLLSRRRQNGMRLWPSEDLSRHQHWLRRPKETLLYLKSRGKRHNPSWESSNDQQIQSSLPRLKRAVVSRRSRATSRSNRAREQHKIKSRMQSWPRRVLITKVQPLFRSRRQSRELLKIKQTRKWRKYIHLTLRSITKTNMRSCPKWRRSRRLLWRNVRTSNLSEISWYPVTYQFIQRSMTQFLQRSCPNEMIRSHLLQKTHFISLREIVRTTRQRKKPSREARSFKSCPSKMKFTNLI